MLTVGLTGSIGMGKSTVTAMFAALGAAVWNADDAVHRLYAPSGRAVPFVAARFPDAVVDGAVDRDRLSKCVLDEPSALADLEAIVHPLVAEDRALALTDAARQGVDVAVLDIPLLFEKGLEKFVDATVVVSAPFDMQRERVLARPGMSERKFRAILAKQTPDAVKRRLADYVIDTGVSLEATRAQVAEVYAALLARA